MSDETELTDEMVETMWGWILPAIDAITERTQDPDDFVVLPGSQLARDDVLTHPYEVSHCARMCLNAGADHLHAVKTLMFDAEKPILHAAADWSLIRGALENFAAAVWVLHPPQRTLRIEHALRWMVKNYKDEKNGHESLGYVAQTPTDKKIDRIVGIATKAHCKEKEVRKGYASKTALEYVQKCTGATNPNGMWQLCSGFAHGRPWANFAMNEMEILDTDSDKGVLSIKLTSDYKRLLAAAWPAAQLMKAVVDLFALRGGAPWM